MLNKEWYDKRIELLRQKSDFLEQQEQVFKINGFERFANELTKEIKFLKADINDLTYEMTLKEVNKEITL